MMMIANTLFNRCRIVLIALPSVEAERVDSALNDSDTASLVLLSEGIDEASCQDFAERVIP